MPKFVQLNIVNPDAKTETKPAYFNIDRIETIASIEVEWSEQPHSIIILAGRGSEENILSFDTVEQILDKIRLAQY